MGGNLGVTPIFLESGGRSADFLQLRRTPRRSCEFTRKAARSHWRQAGADD